MFERVVCDAAAAAGHFLGRQVLVTWQAALARCGGKSYFCHLTVGPKNEIVFEVLALGR
jgi:hypothetical protein